MRLQVIHECEAAMPSVKKRYVVAACVLVLASWSYLASWDALFRLELAQHMANAAYFHYGSWPGTNADWCLYYFYYPAYKTSSWRGSWYGTHWSERPGDGYDHLLDLQGGR